MKNAQDLIGTRLNLGLLNLDTITIKLGSNIGTILKLNLPEIEESSLLSNSLK